MNARGLSAKRGKLLLDFGLGFIIEGGEAAVRSLFQLFDGGLGIALFQIVARQEPELSLIHISASARWRLCGI